MLMDNDHKWTRGVDVMDCGWRLQEIANLRCTGIDFLFYLLYHRAHIILVFYQATLSVLSSSGKSHSAHVHTALSHTHITFFPLGKCQFPLHPSVRYCRLCFIEV